MRKFAFPVIALAALATASPLAAQVRSEIELTRAQIQTERQAIVTEAMALSDADAEVFWPLYREYREEMARVGDRSVELLRQFAETFEAMTNDDADRLLKEWIDIQKQIVSIREKHINNFKKKLPGATVARFFQIENKLDTIVQLDLVASVPLTR